MKKFTIVLLGAIFVALISCSIQSISADDLDPKQGFSEEKKLINFSYYKQVSFSSTKDSKYLIHLHAIVRNAQGQLISVAETMDGKYLMHGITDIVFDSMSNEKEITIVDNIKYQKVHLTQIKNVQEMTTIWLSGMRGPGDQDRAAGITTCGYDNVRADTKQKPEALKHANARRQRKREKRDDLPY